MSSDTAPSTSSADSYSDHPPRITKEDLFMVLALWMEHFPVEVNENLTKDNRNAKRHHKVGAVLVSPNDILHAVDCSRGDVHAVARLLINHPDIAKGCKMFVSRKPCSFCTKLLVQSKVERVFFPPFEPEYHGVSTSETFEHETSQVDTLFTRSSIGQSVFVPKVEEAVLKCESIDDDDDDDEKRRIKEEELFKKFWKEEWMKTVKTKLPWQAFDKKMEDQVKKYFKTTVKWMVQTSGLDVEEVSFEKAEGSSLDRDNGETLDFKTAVHLIRMARFLAARTDDPKKGVGAIIVNKNMEIKGLGWNGFPFKALYGEFPRASDDDVKVKDKKYPFIIHAEQNALLMRNAKKLGKDATLFVTKTPCDECAPLIQMQGIKTVVLGEKMKSNKSGDLTYVKFPKSVKEGDFTCFETKPLITLPSLSNTSQTKGFKDLYYSKCEGKVNEEVVTSSEKKSLSRSLPLPSSCYFHCCCGFCYY